MTGADISFLPFQESQGVQYRDAGVSRDLIGIAKRNGWNIMRVRLWVAPSDEPQFQISNLENVTKLGQRIKAAGFQFLLDIHYADSWADPGQQKKPKAWEALPFPQLVQRVHDYSREVVAHLSQNKARPDIVQIGNEIKNGLLFGSGLKGAEPQVGGGFWEDEKGGMERALRLFAAGARGVREGSPDAPPHIMLHIPDGQDTSFVKWYFSALDSTARAAKPPTGFDFDLIGLSYYPSEPWDRKAGYEPWHLRHLKESMDHLATTWKKPIMVVETDWPHKGDAQAIPGTPDFEFSPRGQAQFYRALIEAVRTVPNGLGRGVLAWEREKRSWHSLFDENGNALPAVLALGQKSYSSNPE